VVRGVVVRASVPGLAVGLALLATGCGGTPAVTAADCADFVTAGVAAATADAPEGTVLTGYEEEMLSPLLAAVRAGVTPFGDDGVGVCRGRGSCDEYVGTDVGELGAGEYIVKAELAVPNVGETGTWKVTFATDCTVTRTTSTGETTSTTNSSREYEVRYAGTDRGYRLIPLRTIKSPSDGGKRECTYTLTAPHPDGDKVYTGSWSVPAAE